MTDRQGDELIKVINGNSTKLLNGVYYGFIGMDGFNDNELFPVLSFSGEAAAKELAADYEATLKKYVYKNGRRIYSTVIYDPRGQ